MTNKNPKDLLFYSNQMGVQIEIPQKLITEALLEGGTKLSKLRDIVKKSHEFAEKYTPEKPLLKSTDDPPTPEVE